MSCTKTVELLYPESIPSYVLRISKVGSEHYIMVYLLEDCQNYGGDVSPDSLNNVDSFIQVHIKPSGKIEWNFDFYVLETSNADEAQQLINLFAFIKEQFIIRKS